MAGTKLLLFGPPRLEREGQPVHLARSRGLALLAYLAREREPQSRDSLIDLLWPAFSPSDARNNLRRELSLLRGVLPLGVLQSDRQAVGIDKSALRDDRLYLDVDAFESELASAHSHNHVTGSLCEACRAALETAVALYAADFLDGFSLPDSSRFDEWQFHQAERLRNSLGRALEMLSTWYGARGEFERGLEKARRWAALDPLNEAAHRTVMRLFESTGQHAAALRHFETTRAILNKELGVDPEAETIDLYNTIRDRRYKPYQIEPNKEKAPQIHLPADTTPFIGREKELAQLQAILVDSKIRLLTLIGIGGIGKTRLALAAARQTVEGPDSSPFPDGVYFVPLSPLTQSAEIAPALALSVGFVPGKEERPGQQLIEFLKSKRLLLIIDNVEHLLDFESITLFGDILRFAPGVKLLATSRVRIGVSGEQIYSLDGLDLPSNELSHGISTEASNLPSYGSAVALFAEAARRSNPAFYLDNSNIDAIASICRLVGGMPLGIEMAAGWTELLSPIAILQEIEKNLNFLVSTQTDIPMRQASLKAVYESSWQFLTDEEKNVLAQLTVFPDSFDRHAAEAIAGASLLILLSLANKSWLQPAGDNRFRIHELLRQYAALELGENSRTLREQHSRYYASYLAYHPGQIQQNSKRTSQDLLTPELDNIRAAMMWLISEGKISTLINKIALPLFHYLESNYRFFLFDRLIIEATRKAEDCRLDREQGILLIIQGAFFFNGYPTRFMDYHWIGTVWPEVMKRAWSLMPLNPENVDQWDIILAWQYGRFVEVEPAVDRLREVISILSAGDKRWEEAFARQSLGRLLSRRPWDAVRYGQEGEARKSLQAALSIFEALKDDREAAITLLFLGFERQSEADFSEAKRLLFQAQFKLESLGEMIIAVNINWQLAEIHMQLGEMEESLGYLHDMAEILLRNGRASLAIASMSRESYEAVRYGDLDYALNLRLRSLELSRQTGEPFNEAWDCWELGEIYRVMGRVDEARQWYEQSRVIFNSISDVSGHSFYYRGLGSLALMEKDYISAREYFNKSIEWSRTTEHPWQMAYALTGLANVEIGLGEEDHARIHLGDALRIGFSTGDAGGLILATLLVASRYYSRIHAPTRSAWLARLVLTNALSWNESRWEAARILNLATEDIPPRYAGELVDLQGVVDEMIGELTGDISQ